MSEIIHAYRTLLRSSLRAVQFSKPARYVVQRRVREAFEKGTPEAYDAEAVRRTVWFLKAAAEERGLEHKIVKNLVRVAWERVRGPNRPGWRSSVRRAESRRLSRPDAVKATSHAHYDATLAMLNHTMGLCLR